MNWRSEFSRLGDSIWLNAAHQGPLPDSSADAAFAAIERKRNPAQIDDESFWSVASALRKEIALLLNAAEDEIALANSASYGLHLFAHAMKWEKGDEIVTLANDFPSNLLPWRLTEGAGVRVRQVQSSHAYPATEEILQSVGPRTRLVCVSHVHSFSGAILDLDAIGSECLRRGVRLLVNASQSAGCKPIDVGALPIDALVSAGFKWLCGPYGTGFVWIHPNFLEELKPTKFYWLRMMEAASLSGDTVTAGHADESVAARFDIFGVANFFNFEAWIESIRLISRIGVASIERHNQSLVERFSDALDSGCYYRCFAGGEARRPSMVFVKPAQSVDIAGLEQKLAAQGINVAVRSGLIRVSPHFYNNVEEVRKAAETTL